MKTTILIISLLTVLLFAAIKNNSSNSVSANNRSELTGANNLSDNLKPNDYINTSDNSDMNDNSNYPVNSYVSGKPNDNSYQTGNSDLTGASMRTEDTNYYDENAKTEDTISFQTIQSSLSSDGQFVTVNNDEIDPENIASGNEGTMDEDIYTDRIWVPNSHYINEGWNPYTNGRWVWTSWGWSWESDYRWGMTYHYGRWWYSPIYGWVWSPGRRYAPAWVFWSHHRDYDGWYPISPRIRHRDWNYTNEGRNHFNQNNWIFVRNQDFTKHVTVSTIMPYAKNKEILVNSNQTLTLKDNGKKIYNPGPDVKSISSVAVNKIDQKPMTKNVTTDIKNQDNKKISVTKTDLKTKPVDIMKKTEINNKKVDNVKTSGNVQKIDTKKSGTVNSTAIDKNKKVDNKSINVKVNNNKTIDNSKSVIKTGNTNKTDTKNINTNNTGIKNNNTIKTNTNNSNTIKTEIKNTNTNNTGIRNSNTIKTDVRNNNINNTNVKNTNTNRTEVKIGNMNNNTGTKSGNTVKTGNSGKNDNPAPKVNPTQNNSNSKKVK